MNEWDSHIDGNDTRRVIHIKRGTGEELDITILTSFKLEEDLLLPDFCEVELVSIKGLQDLVHSELSWPLLEVTALIKLGYKSIFPRNNLKEEEYRHSDLIVTRKETQTYFLCKSYGKNVEVITTWLVNYDRTSSYQYHPHTILMCKILTGIHVNS